MARYQWSKWFANGAGHVHLHHGSSIMIFDWNGKADGFALCYELLIKLKSLKLRMVYERNGKQYYSKAALLRAVESEHGE